MLELLEILFENHSCEKVYLNKDRNHHNHQIKGAPDILIWPDSGKFILNLVFGWIFTITQPDMG